MKLKRILNQYGVFCTVCLHITVSACFVYAENSVSISEIAATWQRTRIKEITCDLRIDTTDWWQRIESVTPSSGDSAGGMGMGGFYVANLRFEIDEKYRRNSVADYTFRRHADFGMRGTCNGLNEDDNVLGDCGVRVFPGTGGLIGMNHVLVQKQGSTLIQSLSRTIALLYWLDPLATKLCTRISRLSEGKLTLIEDPEYGPAVRLTLRESNGTSQVTLAKKHDWRIVSIVRKGSVRNRCEFEYTRHSNGNLLLHRLTTNHFLVDDSEHPSTVVYITLSSCKFGCDPDDLKIELPNNSFVQDYTGEVSKAYFIRADGSIRNTAREEWRMASLSELINTPEGSVFGTSAPNRTSMWIVIAGALMICAAIGLMIKRWR